MVVAASDPGRGLFYISGGRFDGTEKENMIQIFLVDLRGQREKERRMRKKREK